MRKYNFLIKFIKKKIKKKINLLLLLPNKKYNNIIINTYIII